MTQKGLLEWANYMRHSMVSDPGRKLFQEQVQTHGFSFLDDYLDNILSEVKQDPLIELVKTPGRKKVISRKPKLGSKMQAVSVLLEVDNVDDTTERLVPSSNSTQMLLNTANQSDVSEQDPELISPESVTISSSSETKFVPNEPVISPSLELSVIIEDDEGTERSRTSIQTVQMSTDNITSTQTQTQDDRMSNLDLHCPDHNSHGLELPMAPTFQEIKGAEVPAVADLTVPLRDSGSKSFSPPLSTRKSVLSTLPTLPEPILLRKSMRTTKETPVGSGQLGTATPGNTNMGKRTSWLMKAREAKAMETIPKKSVANNLSITNAALVGVKRNSGELTGSVDIKKEERKSKIFKQQKEETAPTKFASAFSPKSDSKLVEETLPESEQDDMLNLLKKKVEGLGARNDKLGDKVPKSAAAALVEARAKAEARIAERQERAPTKYSTSDAAVDVPVDQIPVGKAQPTERQDWLKVHDLSPIGDQGKDKSRGFVFATPQFNPNDSAPTVANDESISTTPPHSPPSQAVAVKVGPVFDKPPPVFVPPIPNPRPLPISPTFKETSSAFIPPSGAFTKLPAVQLGISPLFQSHLGNKTKVPPLSTHLSTLETESDDLFHNRGNTEAWIPKTQEVEYSDAFITQLSGPEQLDALDDDDSWPIDEKLSHDRPWPFGRQSKEDSFTRSTLPSQSQHADTGPDPEDSKFPGEGQACEAQSIPAESDEDMDIEQDDFSAGKEGINAGHELEEIILSKANSVQPGNNKIRNTLVSSVSSESQIGFFGQASKSSSSALGTSNKGKPEVKKVMQMAALAAKKQQENDDKKATRLKEVENRRQLVVQRKAEEEKLRQQEQGRKTKELERRKREREEQMEKKPLKPIVVSTSSKRDDEITKKRKMNSDKPDKKLEPKKQIPLQKTGFKSTLKQATALSSSAAFNTSQSSQSTIKPAEKMSKVPTAIPAKGKTKQKLAMQMEEEHTQPSLIVQTQMAARAKAAMQAEAYIPSESIELPEVNSEYSDSEDEGRPRTFNPPEWAQSPELLQALEAQSTINPDDIFGAIRPLRMEELFKARTSRFRARTSSANWSGADRLTIEEEREYARRMGFK